MAKQKIDTYIFQPGIPVSENRNPHAYELIQNNIEFICDETVAWIAAQVLANAADPTSFWYNYTYNSPKCERDTRYNLQGVNGDGGILYDLRYGGNAQARFLASKYWINSTPQVDGDRQPEVAAKNFVVSLINNYILPQATFTSAQSPVVTTQYTNNGSSYESGSDARVTALFAIITDVITNGLDNVPTLDRTKVSSVKMQTRVPSNDLLLITDTTNNEVIFNFSDPKLGGSCEFQTDDTSQLTKGVEEDFPKFLERTGTITTVYLDKNTDNITYTDKAVAVLEANLEFVKKETVAWIASNVASATSGMWHNYTYNTTKCERDMGLNVVGITKDIKYGGNANTYLNASKYWVQTTPQIDGDRTPEIAAKNFARDLINNYILKNVVYTSQQVGAGAVSQNVILSLPEIGVNTRVTQLFFTITDVIENGLDNLPIEDKTPLYYDTDDLQIFIDQGETRTRPFDFGTDAIERMRVSNSVSMLDADFEYGLQPTKWQAIAMQRGYPSIYEVPGTDKEVASVVTDASSGTGGVGQSLITVTTVGAHGIVAGTPITIKALENSIQGASRAEGSFIISTVPTANTFTFFAKSKVGTSNGQVLSTYYTQLREANFYTGAAIGSPTFSIISQGTAGTFTNPLAAPNGSDKVTWIGNTPEIGAPVQNVAGQIATAGTIGVANASRTAGTYTAISGSSNSIASELIVGTFDIVIDGSGAATSITNFKGGRNNAVGDVITVLDSSLGTGGAPDLTFQVATKTDGTGIGSGAQVTVVTGGGGEIATWSVAGDYASGVNQIALSDVTGVLAGQAIDRGDGTAVHVSSIVGTDVNLDGNTSTAIVGNNVQYTAVAGTNYNSTGFGALWDIDRAGGNYTVTQNNAGGDQYEVDDVIVVLGNTLGGQTTTNDCRITVNSVDSSGSITSFSSAGSAFDGNGSFSNITGQNMNGNGLGAVFDVTYTNNAYTVSLKDPTYANNATGVTQGGVGTGAAWDVVLTNNTYNVTENAGATDAGYIVGDLIRIPGTNFGGSSPTEDLDISITGVDGSGGITSFSASGTGAAAQGTFSEPAYTYSGVGSNATFNVQFTGTTYTASVVAPGSGYGATETCVISGANLGGASPANDATITIDSVDGSGVITAISVTGTAVNSATYTNVTSGANIVGAAASFNITVNYNNSYSVSQGNEVGTNYGNGNTIIVSGANLGGTTPANDLTINVTGANASGGITSFSSSGTAADATSGYAAGDRLQILGTNLGGSSPTHDAIVKVDAVSGTGRINTISITGTAPDATETYATPAYTSNTVGGANFAMNVTRLDTAYSAIVTVGGTGYLAGEEFVVLGSALGGVDVTNNATVTVATVDAGTGEVLTVTVAGTALDTRTITDLSQFDGEANNLTGSTATFDITITGGTYSYAVNTPGTGYYADQNIKIQGNQVGGVTPTNDITINIQSVGAGGDISTISGSGTGPSGTGTYTGISGQNLQNSGMNATFNITRNSGAYSTATVNNDGLNYQVGNKIKIAGTSLGGQTPTNDCVVTISEVATDGGIIASTSSGTAVAGTTVKSYSTVTMSESLTSGIPQNTTIQFAALATVEVSFTTAHGLIPGDAFIVTVSTDDGTNNHTLLEGPFFAQQVPTTTSLRYQCRAAGAISDVGDINAVLYPRPDSFFVHRPYDGGVMLGTGGPQHGAQAIRQSKKYIRYQSGKGIMYTTGALFAPSYDLLTVQADAVAQGSFINITTDDVDHGLQVGGQVKLIGIETPGYNGPYTVSAITSERTFKVIAQTGLGATTPVLSAKAQVSLLNWHGATVRSGAFDDQNGIFMEYDGSNFNAVQRTATLQLSGTISLAVDSNAVTGSGTRFRDQIKAGDRIVIKGMTHVVSQVVDQTSMNVTPDFRGVTPASGAKLCLVSDKKSKQADFNKDKLDGSGSSGYIMDISKMQMIGIQYSWYGAGFIDWMLRGDDGNFIFYHRMRNSNVNTEAFMRTGNMPVRYEVSNEGPNDKLAADMNDTQNTIPLEDASFFPDNGGTVIIDNEMIQYTGITGDTLTGCTRSAPLTNFAAGATRTYTAGVAATHTARTGVILISNTITPIISHWGSAFQTDGGFDSDRGYIFSYTSTANTISSTRNTVFMLRLAPSVSNAIVGDLGERELLNRAQLLLEGVEITSDGSNGGTPIVGGIVVEGILNPQNYPLDPGDVGWAALTGSAAGGQPSFAQIAPGGSVVWSTGATQVTRNGTIVAEMTNDVVAQYNRNNTQWHWITNASWNLVSSEVTTGQTVTATGTPGSGLSDFPAGTTITDIYENYNPKLFRFSNRNTSTISASETITVSVNPGASLTGTNYLYFTKTSWEATGAISGTEVNDSKFPGGTYVSGVQGPLSYGGTEYYRITFTQTSNTTINAGDTVGFLFGQPPYAQPGETVFSFIATPGEQSSLDLSTLKELTNTTLGGRGTFPNGPDVLAINVYKAEGADTKANIILRWGEAQA